MEIAGTVRSARLRAGLTQQGLADRAGTSQATVSAYEAGRKQPSAETFARLLAACGERLQVVAAAAPVRATPERELVRRGRILEQVLELAEALPSRRAPTLGYPSLAAAAGPSAAALG